MQPYAATVLHERDDVAPRPSKHFFKREEDGWVRIRLRLSPEEADLIEEAAGDTPLPLYLKRALLAVAQRHAERSRAELERKLSSELPPVDDDDQPEKPGEARH